MLPAVLDKKWGKEEKEDTSGNNLNEKCHLEFSSVSLYSAFNWKVVSESKIAFIQNTYFVHEKKSIFHSYLIFFHTLISMTLLSPSWIPQPLLQAISLWNYFPERDRCYRSLVKLHTSTAFGSDSSIINLLCRTVGRIWKVPVSCPWFLNPVAETHHDWAI